jgi:hypothetical protein
LTAERSIAHGVLADAARYAVLRRLAPALRHKLIGELHPLRMVADLAARRLQAAAPDLANLRDCMSKIKEQTQAAAASCTATIDWVAPEPTSVTALGQGVAECVALLSAELGMRGFDLMPNVQAGDALVSQPALRDVLTASLLALTDALTQPADIELTAVTIDEHVELCIEAHAADRVADPLDREIFRPIQWDDVAALAAVYAFAVTREQHCVVLRCRPLPKREA